MKIGRCGTFYCRGGWGEGRPGGCYFICYCKRECGECGFTFIVDEDHVEKASVILLLCTVGVN